MQTVRWTTRRQMRDNGRRERQKMERSEEKLSGRNAGELRRSVTRCSDVRGTGHGWND